MRTPAEILATLDADGCLDGVPFMPEMLRRCGNRFRVTARVERACDTVTYAGVVRRMPDTVFLADLRCGGEAHGGCQSGCRLYWKEAWLKRVEQEEPLEPPARDDAYAQLERLARERAVVAAADSTTYRCQATEFLRATEPLRWWDIRSFLRELSTGNVGPWRFALTCANLVVEEIARRLGLYPREPRKRSALAPSIDAPLCLRSGDLVRVRSKAEIQATLDDRNMTRGLFFDREMLPYCDTEHPVNRKVVRFIDESSGRMIELKSDCLILDDVVCHGYRSYGRWFCQRAIYPWWRECWLQSLSEGLSEGSNGRGENDQAPEVGAVSAELRPDEVGQK